LRAKARTRSDGVTVRRSTRSKYNRLIVTAQPDSRPSTRVSIITIVLNWNNWGTTLQCLGCLAMQTRTSDVIVIDNGSNDDSVARIAADTPLPVELITLPQNIGFAAGMNVGIRAAMQRSAKYVWLLNNDAFAAPECLDELVEFMEQHPSIVMATPRLLNPDGSEQPVGGVLDWRTGFMNFHYCADMETAKGGVWLTGAAPILRADSLCVTAFDPRFFAYWEDVDLSLRLTRAGGKLAAVMSAVVVHREGETSGGGASPFVQYLTTRNEWLVIRRLISGRFRLAAALQYCSRKLRKAGTLNLKGQATAATAIVRGTAAAMMNRFGEPPASVESGELAGFLARHPWRLVSTLEWLSRLVDQGS
jgi:GT2 family glycosyltransferase